MDNSNHELSSGASGKLTTRWLENGPGIEDVSPIKNWVTLQPAILIFWGVSFCSHAMSCNLLVFVGSKVLFWMMQKPFPIRFMYGIFTCTYHKNQPNVIGEYTTICWIL